MDESYSKNYIDFSVIREEFSTYKLENGIVFRLKAPIVALSETIKNNEAKGNATTAILSYVEIPANFNTSDLQTIDYNSKPKQTKKLRITQRKEINNIYETKSQFIIIGIHVYEVFITDKKDLNGIPILFNKNSIATSIVEKPTYPSR